MIENIILFLLFIIIEVGIFLWGILGICLFIEGIKLKEKTVFTILLSYSILIIAVSLLLLFITILIWLIQRFINIYL